MKAAQRLKDKGILVYTFGIKPRVDTDELLGVASKPQYYLEANSYDDYAEFAQELADLICDGKHIIYFSSSTRRERIHPYH